MFLKPKPSTLIIAGYNNTSSLGPALIIGSNNKLRAPFVTCIGSGNTVTNGTASGCLVMGHNNTIHNASGMVIGDNNTVLPNRNIYAFGSNNYIQSGVNDSYVFGSNLNVTASNSFNIGGDLNVGGNIIGGNIIGATGPVGATGPAGQSAYSYTPQATNDVAGATGDIVFDDRFIYIRTTKGWFRSALSSF